MLCTLVNLNLARFLNILLVTSCVNKTRSKNTKFNFKTCLVMWVAGLRGAMAYALAISSVARFGQQSQEAKEAGQVILVVTLIYSLFTILGISSILHPIMTKCEVRTVAITSEDL